MGKKTKTAPAVEVQGELLRPELPDYHGRKPAGMRTKVSGYWTRLGRLHKIDDAVVAVVEFKVKGDGHDKIGDQVDYVEKLVVVDAWEITDPSAAKRLVSSLRQAYRDLDDAAANGGTVKLGELGVEGTGDLDRVAIGGVALTPEELAAIRDDPERALADPRVTPAVVEWSDGSRTLWPDEFGPGETRPYPGERVDGGTGPAGYLFVRALTDAATGETIGEWSDAQEEERLRRLEGKAAAVEDGDPIAHYRVEYEDGSLAELDPSETIGPGGMVEAIETAVRVYAVHDSGARDLVKGADDVDEPDVSHVLREASYYRRMTVAQVVEYVSEIDDVEFLGRVRVAFVEGRKRQAVKALDERVAELSS